MGIKDLKPRTFKQIEDAGLNPLTVSGEFAAVLHRAGELLSIKTDKATPEQAAEYSELQEYINGYIARSNKVV